MAKFEQWFEQDFSHEIKVWHRESVMFTGDDQGALVGVRLFNNGTAYSSGGTVSGAVKRSDGGVVALSGTLSGNAASVVIPAAALAYAGPIGVRIILTQGGSTTTILKVIYTVDDDSGTNVDPGTIIPSVSDLISAIETAVDSIPADYSSLLAGIAPTFSASESYAAGQFVWHSGVLYRFSADHAAGSWTGSDAAVVVLSNEAFKYIKNMRSANGDLIDEAITPGIYRWNASARPSDCPRAAAGRMLVIGPRDSYISTKSQLITFDDGQMFFRSGLNNETWASWGVVFGYVKNLTSSDTVDGAILPGMYRWNANTRPADSPVDEAAKMIVIGAYTSNIYARAQLVISDGGNMYFRSGQANDTWGSWQMIFNYVKRLTTSDSMDTTITPGMYRWNATNGPDDNPLGRVAGRMIVINSFSGSISTCSQIMISTDGTLRVRSGQAPSGQSSTETWGQWIAYRAPDATLTISGAPADAKATGDAIAPIRILANGAVQKTSVASYMESGTAIGEVDGKVFRVPVSATGEVDLSNYYTKEEANARFDQQPLKLRILQNNAGCWRFGFSPSDLPSAYELTPQQLAEKIANYKKLYIELQPDVICLQEYIQYMDQSSTVDAQTEIFDPLYHFRYISSQSKPRAIFTNHPCTFSLVTVDFASTSGSYVDALLASHAVHVVTFALHPGSDSADLDLRAAQFSAYIASLDDYQNVILCADLNAASASELAGMITTAKAHGFHSFMSGDFFGYQNSYINRPGSTTADYFRQIDAIWCKGNMSMVYAKVLKDETTDYPSNAVWNPSEVVDGQTELMIANQHNSLLSDHIPVIADITVWG